MSHSILTAERNAQSRSACLATPKPLYSAPCHRLVLKMPHSSEFLHDAVLTSALSGSNESSERTTIEK